MKTDGSYQVHKIDRHCITDVLSRELGQEPNLAFAYLYGSALEQDSIHDVDVGVYLFPSQYQSRLEQAVGIGHTLSMTLKIPVDVRTLNNAPISFLYHVLRGQLLVCRDENLLSSLIENTAREYLDLAPLLRQSTKDAFAA